MAGPAVSVQGQPVRVRIKRNGAGHERAPALLLLSPGPSGPRPGGGAVSDGPTPGPGGLTHRAEPGASDEGGAIAKNGPT